MDDEPQTTMQLLDIYGTHRPHALKKEVTDCFAAAAAVCMERHYSSPQIWSVRADDDDVTQYRVHWAAPSDEDRRTYNDDDEATEYGACSLALAAVDVHLKLTAYSRATKKTGVDFYLCIPRDSDAVGGLSYDLDHQYSIGLEISGISEDTDARMSERVRRKVVQIRRGRSPDRAIAGVVGFRGTRVVFRTAKP